MRKTVSSYIFFKNQRNKQKPQHSPILIFHHGSLRQHRTIPALRLKHRSGGCGTASALPKCSITSGCGTRIVLRGQKPLALCAFGLASAAPRSPYRHLKLCGIAFIIILTHAGNNVRPRRLPKPRAVRGGFFLCQPPPCATILVYFAAALPAARGTLKEEPPCLPLLCAA